MQRLFPAVPDHDREEPEPYASLDLSDGPPERPYVVANMVSTVDGKVALGGTARGLGSAVDRRLMRLIAVERDAS